MTNAPKNPHTALIQELIGYIRALIEDFPLGQDVPQSGSFKRLEASLKKLQESPPLVTDYLLLAFNAVTIQWAAHETGGTAQTSVDSNGLVSHAASAAL